MRNRESAADQLVDCRLAQFRIGRVSHSSACGHFRPQRAFRSQCDVVLGRFAIDQKLAPCRSMIVRDLRAETVALFSNDEEESDVKFLACRKRSAAAICAAMIPLASHDPRP